MYDFANILFAGRCNRSCPFCIGRQLPGSVNVDNLDVWPPRGIESFIETVNRERIPRVVFTGTVSDPQLYRYEGELLDLLRRRLRHDVSFSVHTNGVLTLGKIDVFNRYDRPCISFPSFRPDTYEKMMGSRRVPDLERILRAAYVPVKVSAVVSEHNAPEVDEFLAECRRIGVKRLVYRRQFRETRQFDMLTDLPVVRHFRGNPVMDYHGMEVTYWDFDRSLCESVNLFPDGTLGTSYLLAETRQIRAAGDWESPPTAQGNPLASQ